MRRAPFLGVLALLAWPAWCSASHTIVPDNYAAVPAAIASGADTVLIRDGSFLDPISIPRALALAPMAPTSSQLPLPYPTLGPITIDVPTPGAGMVSVKHMRVTGPVTWNASQFRPDLVSFEDCRLDAGLTTTPTTAIVGLRLYGCVIRGEVFAAVYYPDVVGCTFLQCGLQVQSNGAVSIRDNYFQGPAAWGIRACCSDASWNVSHNYITGTTVGIWASAGTFTANEVHDTQSAACEADGASGNVTFQNNVVVHAGGNGIDLSSTGSPARSHAAFNNLIQDAAGDGIHSTTLSWVRGNTVLRSGDDGIEITSGYACNANTVLNSTHRGIVVNSSGGAADSNVVGRSGADGMAIAGVDEALQNTSYLNGGNGFTVTGVSVPVHNNIGYGNIGYGVSCSATGSAALGCNDWYGNTAGSSRVCAPVGTDLTVLPGFCNLPLDDVHLSGSSPLLNAPGCGLIGALPQGCGAAAAVVPPPNPISSPRVSPLPAQRAVHFSWDPYQRVDRVEVYDVLGSRVRTLAPGAVRGEIEWDGSDDAGRLVPVGVYHARFVAPNGARTVRVVFVR